jgi:thymidylate synthase (FAD)
MKVRLLRHTENPAELVLTAMGKCYDSSPSFESLRAAIKAGHTSILEHVVFTWEIQGVSRVLLAQLTRHRIASYTVRSQRYCDESRVGYYDLLSEEPMSSGAFSAHWAGVFSAYRAGIAKAFSTYREMVDAGMPREIARYVLPQATFTELIMTMNARELHDVFFPLRLSKRAQPEIRKLAQRMLVDCCRVAPEIFGEHEDWLLKEEDSQ